MDNANLKKSSQLTAEVHHDKPLVKDLNGILICILCGGYYIDATAIVDCLHTFCKSCIVKYLETNTKCPICDVIVHKSDRLQGLRPDRTLQSLLYKIIPGLYNNEIERRKRFELEKDVQSKNLQLDLEAEDFRIYSPTDIILISLEYLEQKSSHLNGVNLESFEESQKYKIAAPKYLECPAAFQIGHLQKFLRAKYNLAPIHEVEIFYADQRLPCEFTLIDVAYTYCWNRTSAMHFQYCILTPSVIRLIATKIDQENIINSAIEEKDKSNLLLNEAKRKPDKIIDEFEFVDDIQVEDNEVSIVAIKRKKVGGGRPAQKNKKRKISNDSAIEIITLDNSSDNGSIAEDPNNNNNKNDNVDLEKQRISKRSKKYNDDNGNRNKDEIFVNTNNCCNRKVPTENDQIINSPDYEMDIEEVELEESDEIDQTNVEMMEVNENDQEDFLLSMKCKRKNKKSKRHHHHRHHHHKHHDKKKPPPATIVHSPDRDIMKLKVKLNTVQQDSSSKHHKQSRKDKRKISNTLLDVIQSSNILSDISAAATGFEADTSKDATGLDISSSSSVSSSSSGGATSSRIDEDSSHVSELSFSSGARVDIMFKEEKINDVDVDEKHLITEVKSATTALQSLSDVTVTSVDHKGDRVVINGGLAEVGADKTLEEMNLDVPEKDNPNNPIVTVTENDCLDKKQSQPIRKISISAPSSITVSKITAAQKRKMEQEKIDKINYSIEHDNTKKPSLEIVLVNKLPTSAAAAANSNNSISSKDSMAKTSTTGVCGKTLIVDNVVKSKVICNGHNNNIEDSNMSGKNNKIIDESTTDEEVKRTKNSAAAPKQIRPPPPAIPITIFTSQKMKAAVNEMQKTQGLTIIPHNTKFVDGIDLSKPKLGLNNSLYNNHKGTATTKKSTSPKKSQNSKESDNNVLDLSGSGPTKHTRNSKSPSPAAAGYTSPLTCCKTASSIGYVPVVTNSSSSTPYSPSNHIRNSNNPSPVGCVTNNFRNSKSPSPARHIPPNVSYSKNPIFGANTATYSPNLGSHQLSDPRLKATKSNYSSSLRTNVNVVPPSVMITTTGGANCNDFRYTPATYSPVRCLTSLSDSMQNPVQYRNATSMQNFRSPKYPELYPTIRLPKYIPPPPLSLSISNAASSVRMQNFTKPKVIMPKLNEIKIGPLSLNSETPKPGPNQTIRQIPNPSVLLHRHQITSKSSVSATTGSASNHPRTGNNGVINGEPLIRCTPISLTS